jgi:hypothetical protein
LRRSPIAATDLLCADARVAVELDGPQHLADGRNRRWETLAHLMRRFSADAAYPLIGAGGRVSGLARSPALESARVHVLAAAEERPEECNLGRRRRLPIDRCFVPAHGNWLHASDEQTRQSFLAIV